MLYNLVRVFNSPTLSIPCSLGLFKDPNKAMDKIVEVETPDVSTEEDVDEIRKGVQESILKDEAYNSTYGLHSYFIVELSEPQLLNIN